MKLRALILGLLGTLLMGAYGQYASKYVPGMWGLVRGYLPVAVYGLLAFYVALVNPLLGRLRKSWRLRPAEMALIIAMMLVGCGITDGGMMRYFPRLLVHPMVLERSNPTWQQIGVLDYTPPAFLANGGKYSDAVVEDFVSPMWNHADKVPFGKSPPYGLWQRLTGSEPPADTVTWGHWFATCFGRAVPLTRLPWKAWLRPLLLWTSVICLTMVAIIALSLVVHRQWAERERIRYPLADLATSLLRSDAHGRILIARNRLFWLGLAVPFVVRLINGLHQWFPESISIPLFVDLSVLNQSFPEFMKTPGARVLLYPTLYPACIGLTYLLASEIGFSLGFVGLASVAAMAVLMKTGVDLAGSDMAGGIQCWYSFGSSLAMGIMLFWIGRSYYLRTLKAAVTFRPQAETDASAVRALRVCVLAVALATIILARNGMDPLMAALALLLALLFALLISRVNAEAGLFYFGIGWTLPGALIGLFGKYSLGPTIIICLGMMRFLLQGESDIMMPFVTNGLKMTADAGLRAGRTALVLTAALLLTIAVAVPTALWADYNHAAALRRGYSGANVYHAAGSVAAELQQSGKLDEVMDYRSWDRVLNMRPSSMFWGAAGVGFVLLLLCAAMRMRFSWWPLHPVAILFALEGANHGGMGRFSFSFLCGWAIKASVMKYGGGAFYSRLKPMMIGVVVGDLSGGFVFLAVSWIYYACTGLTGRSMLLW